MPWYNTVICNDRHCGCGNGCLCLALLRRLSIVILKIVWERGALVHTCSAIRHSACKQSEHSNKYRLHQVYTALQVDLHLVSSAALTFVRTSTVVCIVFMRNGNVLLVGCHFCQPAVYCTYVGMLYTPSVRKYVSLLSPYLRKNLALYQNVMQFALP